MRGFTLIEILVAITVIGIVSVLVIPNLNKFSKDQDFSSQSGRFLQTLRQAQSNAQSGLQCPSPTKAAISWQFIYSTINKNYYLVANCSDITNQNQPTIALSNITFDAPTNCGDITFTKNSISFSGSASSCTITLRNSPTLFRTFTIDKGGSIN